jgi:hypothetical protein
MAIFNPDVAIGKDGVPDYTKLTKPVDSYIADKSTGIALNTAGEGIGNISGIVEYGVKDYLNKDIRNRIEPIREDYTQDLLNAKRALQGQTPQTMGSVQEYPPGVGETGPEPLPPAGVQSGLRRVDRIQNMLLTGSGKVAGDDTYYDMRLKSEVTSLRADYPGFIDYIDQRVAAITGMNPANEVVKDLTRQLAQLQTNKKTELDKALDLAIKNGDMRDMKQQYDTLRQRGESYLPTFWNYYFDESRKRGILEDQERRRKALTGDREEVARTQEANLTNEYGALVSTKMGTIVGIAGVSEKKSLNDFIADAAANPNKYPEQVMQQFASQVLAYKAQAEAEADTIARKQKTDDAGRTYTYESDITSGKAAEIKKNVISQSYQAVADALLNKDAGLAFAHANRAKAMLAQTTDEIYSGPMGRTFMLMKFLEQQGGPNWQSLVNTQLIKHRFDTSVDKLFENEVLAAKTGQAGLNPEGRVPTFNDFATKNPQISPRLQARYAEAGMNIFLEDLTKKEVPLEAKVKAFQFFFSPQGQDVLRKFKNDYTDVKGNFYPGKQTIWTKLSSDEVIANIEKMSTVDPNIKTEYRNWMEREAGKNLYQEDLRTLNGVLPDAHVLYNDGEGKRPPTVTLMSNATGLPLQMKDLGHTSVSDNYYRTMQASVNRVNMALSGMDRVYKATGENTSDRLLQFMLSQAQADVLGGGWKGISEDILKAVAANRGKGKLQDVLKETK